VKNRIRCIFTIVAVLAFAFTKAHGEGFASNIGNRSSEVTINASIIAGLNDPDTIVASSFGIQTLDRSSNQSTKVNESLRSLLKAGFPGVAITFIPEPSVYATILGVASLGFVMIRRRRQQ
jgi:hypothetical protein